MRRLKKLTAVILAIFMLCSCSAMDNNPQASNSDNLPRQILMPKDNPPPVTIDRADAATPTPISYIKKIKGKEMDVEVQIYRDRAIHNYNEKWESHIAVIRTYDEFKTLYAQDIKNPDKENCYSGYNEKHFKDNLVIVLFENGIGGSDTYAIEKVTKSKEKMQIYLKQTGQGQATILGNLRVFISIPKKSMENIESIVVCEEKYKYIFG